MVQDATLIKCGQASLVQAENLGVVDVPDGPAGPANLGPYSLACPHHNRAKEDPADPTRWTGEPRTL